MFLNAKLSICTWRSATSASSTSSTAERWSPSRRWPRTGAHTIAVDSDRRQGVCFPAADPSGGGLCRHRGAAGVRRGAGHTLAANVYSTPKGRSLSCSSWLSEKPMLGPISSIGSVIDSTELRHGPSCAPLFWLIFTGYWSQVAGERPCATPVYACMRPARSLPAGRGSAGADHLLILRSVERDGTGMASTVADIQRGQPCDAGHGTVRYRACGGSGAMVVSDARVDGPGMGAPAVWHRMKCRAAGVNRAVSRRSGESHGI